MLVMNKLNRKVVEATKNEDGTYTVEGKTLTREQMSEQYGKAPEAKKEEVVDMSNVISGETEIGGDIGGLAGALAKCQGEFTGVKKGTQGHGYSYADIEAVLSNSSPITSKNGIAITQMNLSKNIGNRLLVGVKTILMHSSGGYVSSEIYVEAVKTKMNSLVQMAGVNITYLRRYGIQSALGLATTDNDGSDK